MTSGSGYRLKRASQRFKKITYNTYSMGKYDLKVIFLLVVSDTLISTDQRDIRS